MTLSSVELNSRYKNTRNILVREYFNSYIKLMAPNSDIVDRTVYVSLVNTECLCFVGESQQPRRQPSQAGRAIPVQIQVQSAQVPASEQQAPQEPRKYTGGAIPSRSFQMLQAMVAPDVCGRSTTACACGAVGCIQSKAYQIITLCPRWLVAGT